MEKDQGRALSNSIIIDRFIAEAERARLAFRGGDAIALPKHGPAKPGYQNQDKSKDKFNQFPVTGHLVDFQEAAKRHPSGQFVEVVLARAKVMVGLVAYGALFG